MRELLIIRTHRADRQSLDAFDRYAVLPGRQVVFACDERNGPVDTQGRAKVILDWATLRRLGVYDHPSAGWRCGDYFLYVARLAYPDFDAYWMIEPDVVLNVSEADLPNFLGWFSNPLIDFTAVRFSRSPQNWRWRRTVEHDYSEVYRCCFPITRLSARAIDHLLGVRQARSVAFDKHAEHLWPNDEAFVACELMRAGFVCCDFARDGRPLYSERSFRTEWLLGLAGPIPSDLSEAGPDGMIWHPVRDYDDWLGRFASALERRPAPARQSASAAAQLRAANVFIEGAARLLAQGRHAGAALLPLVIAERRLRCIADGQGGAGEPSGALVQARLTVSNMLDRSFGLNGGKRVHVATAHACLPAPDSLAVGATRPQHFELGQAIPIGLVPRGFLLPHAVDLRRRELLLTLHGRPERVLKASLPCAEQGASAQVVLRVPFDRLDQALGPLDPEARPIFLLSIGRTGLAFLRSLAGCVTPMGAPATGTMRQLSEQHDELSALGPELRARVVWHSIEPLLSADVGAGPPAPRVIALGADANVAIGDLLNAFPRARFVFMLRQRVPWARSVYRAFRWRPEIAVAQLVQGLKAIQVLVRSRASHEIVYCEQLAAAPHRIVAKLAGLPEPLPPSVAEAVDQLVAASAHAPGMAAHSRSSPPAPEEEGWLAAFNDAWLRRKPARLIERLGLSLE